LSKYGSLSYYLFLISGLINSFITYLIYLFFLLVLSFPYLISYSITYVIGIILGYFLNLHFVFKNKNKPNAMLYYPFLYMVNYVLNISLLKMIVSRFEINQELAPLLISFLTSVPMYLISKLIFGRKNENTN